ncbi:DUF1707 and DUF4190 domain-containing protein [Streptomyces sp. MST-110588]|uniref:DUF1707 and DUF4190 domain-containing protein n=1 Tax=Streptomyces sp. MST-110588 TaxID=2833628 RepID=UPI001F5E173F|nr:DUF1707 and DUF4190 domain-containing protein [Streptomyces sp. MST-110588]UNO44042.1 DUF1707 and DUF4190 domain-containing protein [Streptomyces sp. MST-110588]
MRASHADRERAVDVLKAGFAEGRLAQPEYEQRMTRAYQAQTHAELQMIVSDLPQGPVPQAAFTPRPQVPATFMPMAPPVTTNASSTGALVCGILAPFTMGVTAIPAVILGHKARAEIRRTGEGGDGQAVAGLVLGWMGIAGWAMFLLFMMLIAVASV